MSSEDFRKVIDDARQILVGKLPNPQDQIDAITYALMYKFMSDVDDQSASLPTGKRTYFSGDYEKYSWHNLMRADGQDQLILYREAIEKMSRNPGLPALFREIFTGAILKFNDPRTLRLFLKEMDKFQHGTNDDLGDVYEYLLSLMGSQGGLGQFRTPRHIIKFIVDVVDPDKTDKIMDPAAGTGGFLIEAYKHILAKHDGVDENGKQNNEKRLTAAERDKIHDNFRGFDIDATMIRTSRVNMYLHGFKTPDIIEHDTLTSEDYWNDRYNVILANPPFMTPKGGIQPHKKFGVRANRAEVLFADYIATHLKPNGRAGFIVPEGIIFQSGTAYKQLRKQLVENSLYAVVSLPAGVFQPYSGVKTSILFLDPEIAAKQDTVLFGQVSGDGYTLTTKRALDPLHNDLPHVLDAIRLWKAGYHDDSSILFAVPKSEIAKTVDYNLSAQRYMASVADIESVYPLVRLGDVVNFIGGGTPSRSKSDYWGGDIKWITAKYFSDDHKITGYENITEDGLKNSSANIAPKGSVILISRVSVGKFAFADNDYALNQDLTALVPKADANLSARYLFAVSAGLADAIAKAANGVSIKGVSRKFIADLMIPLPPLDVQERIVAEIEAKQNAIDETRNTIARLERERDEILPAALTELR